MIARPTAASAAASMMTKIAKIWPSVGVPSNAAKRDVVHVGRVRRSSIPMRMPIAFRRVSTV